MRQQTAYENPFDIRVTSQSKQKAAIARAAASLFGSGDSLLIDSGSTTPFFAEALGKVGSYTVITNSPLVAIALCKAPLPSDVFLLGGRFKGEATETVGPIALEQIQRLSADHAVLTVGAVNAAGRFMDFNGDEAYIARAMIERASKVTILADSTKLGRDALFMVCEADRVHRLVTDARPPKAVADSLAAGGVEVILAE